MSFLCPEIPELYNLRVYPWRRTSINLMVRLFCLDSIFFIGVNKKGKVFASNYYNGCYTLIGSNREIRFVFGLAKLKVISQESYERYRRLVLGMAESRQKKDAAETLLDSAKDIGLILSAKQKQQIKKLKRGAK